MTLKKRYLFFGIGFPILLAVLVIGLVRPKEKKISRESENKALPADALQKASSGSDPVPVQQRSAGKSALPQTNPVLQDLGLELKATMVASGFDSHAIILKKKENREILVKTGETIGSAVVKNILHEKVQLETDGRLVWLALKINGTQEDMPASSEKILTVPVQISWEDLDDLSENMLTFGRSIQIAPHFEEGGTKGLQVAFLKEEAGLASKLGLQQGDIITAVNGNTIASGKDIPNPYDLLEQLQASGAMQVDISRNGSPGRLNITIE